MVKNVSMDALFPTRPPIAGRGQTPEHGLGTAVTWPETARTSVRIRAHAGPARKKEKVLDGKQGPAYLPDSPGRVPGRSGMVARFGLSCAGPFARVAVRSGTGPGLTPGSNPGNGPVPRTGFRGQKPGHTERVRRYRSMKYRGGPRVPTVAPGEGVPPLFRAVRLVRSGPSPFKAVTRVRIPHGAPGSSAMNWAWIKSRKSCLASGGHLGLDRPDTLNRESGPAARGRPGFEPQSGHP